MTSPLPRVCSTTELHGQLDCLKAELSSKETQFMTQSKEVFVVGRAGFEPA